MKGYQVLGISLGAIAAVLAVLAVAFAIAAVGGIFWMLAIKFVAWLLGMSVSWTAAYGIGFALALIAAALRGGR